MCSAFGFPVQRKPPADRYAPADYLAIRRNRMIEYRQLKPPLHDYKSLFESTGWTSSIAISDDVLQKVIDNSWYWISAFDKERLVGVGRLLSDGALYALVCDIIVLPGYQGQGIGEVILKMLKDKCRKNGIQRVWLFAAQGRTRFYIRNGFDIRPADAPGMQLKKTCSDA
jgi:GNAT superfamily N-acetyltransferase